MKAFEHGGHLMDSYDQGWEDRFNGNMSLIKALEKRLNQEWSDEAHDALSMLHKEVPGIYVSQFRTTLEYEKFLRERHFRCAEETGARLPDLRFDASREEIDEAFAGFRALTGRVRAYRRLPEPEELYTGLFSETNPENVPRTIETAAIEIQGRALEARLIIEKHDDGFHVCVVEDPLSVFTVLSSCNGYELAEYLEGELRPGKRTLLNRLFGRYQEPVFVYKFFSPLCATAPGARIYPFELVKDGFDRPCLRELDGIFPATPIMMDELLKLDPELARVTELAHRHRHKI